MFKTPASKTFTHPPYLFDNSFTPRSGCTPVKRAMAAERKRHEKAARHASGPADKLPRPTPDIPEQGEAEAEQPEHVTEKPNVHTPSHPNPDTKGGRKVEAKLQREAEQPPAPV